MQRLLFGVCSALLMLCSLVPPAAGQIERILLVGGNYRIQTTVNNLQDGFFWRAACQWRKRLAVLHGHASAAVC